MQKITPFLWFDHQAEEAMNFYTSVFKNSRMTADYAPEEVLPTKTGADASLRVGF